MDKLLEDINEIIEEEHGEAIGWEDTIISSGIDSFGITMVIMAINDNYDVWSKKELGKINYPKITPTDILEKINENK